jgi:phosphoribosyl-ATP pyrophosphohydrolase
MRHVGTLIAQGIVNPDSPSADEWVAEEALEVFMAWLSDEAAFPKEVADLLGTLCLLMRDETVLGQVQRRMEANHGRKERHEVSDETRR